MVCNVGIFFDMLILNPDKQNWVKKEKSAMNESRIFEQFKKKFFTLQDHFKTSSFKKFNEQKHNVVCSNSSINEAKSENFSSLQLLLYYPRIDFNF